MLVSALTFGALAVAIAASATLMLAPTERAAPSDPIALEAHVGRSVTIEARSRGDANRYPGAPIAGKSAYWVSVIGGRRIVVHSTAPLDCAGVLVLTGTVVRVASRFSRSSSVAYQLDLSNAACR